MMGWALILNSAVFGAKQSALKLTDTRFRSLLFLGTLWGNHDGNMNIVPSLELKTTWGLVMGSISPGNGFGLYS